MSIGEMAGKVIERTESLTESHLAAAVELTKIIYSDPKIKTTEEELLKTFFNFYEVVKRVAPPPLEKFTSKGRKKYILIGGIIIVGLLGLAALKLLYDKGFW